MDPRIAEDSDDGIPFTIKHSNTAASLVFKRITDQIEEKLDIEM